MKHRKWIKMILAAACTAAALVLLMYLEFLMEGQKEPDPTEKVQVMAKDLYNGYGLEGNQELSDVIIYENEEVSCYADRILRRFSYDESQVQNTAGAVQGMKDQNPSLEHIYVMPIPPKVVLEEGYEADQDAYQAYLERMASSLPEWTSLVDVLPELAGHEEEYVFFRTEDSWTAKGAYYGSSVLGRAMGLEPFSLENYEEYMYNSFKGSLLQKYEDDPQLAGRLGEMPEDRVYYYLLPDGKNRERIEKEEGQWSVQPAISHAAGGLGTFVSGGYLSAVVEGDQKRKMTGEETLLLICDDRGKLLAPFLANYYKAVYVINVTEDTGFSADMAGILAEYGVKHVVWAQSSLYMGDMSYCGAVNGFLNQNE